MADQRTVGTEDISSVTQSVSGVEYTSKVVAYPIQIRWKPGDLTTSSTTSPTNTITDTPTNLVAPADETATKIGVGVGISVLGLILIVVGVVWYYRRRAVASSTSPILTTDAHSKVELEANNVNARWNRVPPPAELQAHSRMTTLGQPVS